MPILTVECLLEALRQLTPSATTLLHEQIQTAKGIPPVQLCIFERSERASFQAAWSRLTTTKSESLKSDKAQPLSSSIQQTDANMLTVQDKAKENTNSSNTTWSEIREKEWQRNVSEQLQSYISSLVSKCDEEADEQAADEEEITLFRVRRMGTCLRH